jgi:hypothetical protein
MQMANNSGLGRPLPREKPPVPVEGSLASLKDTPREQKFMSSQDADTQALTDTFLAEQQRGPDETELDLIVGKIAKKSAAAAVGYGDGEALYGMPFRANKGRGLSASGVASPEAKEVFKDIFPPPSFLPSFVPEKRKGLWTAVVNMGSQANQVEGLSDTEYSTIRHELEHLAYEKIPKVYDLFGELESKYGTPFGKSGENEEIFIRVKDYMEAYANEDKERMEEVKEYLEYIDPVRFKHKDDKFTPLDFYNKNKHIFEAVDRLSQVYLKNSGNKLAGMTPETKYSEEELQVKGMAPKGFFDLKAASKEIRKLYDESIKIMTESPTSDFIQQEEFKKGGTMAELTIGLQDEGGMIDKESGNEVPNGALKEEVRDDQPAMLSPGEFVIPAYAVRYVGVERLVKLLREAKQGMEQLDDIGLTGEPNADDAGLETAMLPSDMQEGEDSAAFAVGGLQQPTGVYGANLNRPTQQQFGQQQFGQQQFAAPTQQQFAQPAAFAPSSVLASPLSAPQYKPTVPIKTDKKFTYPEMVYTPGPTGPGYGVAEYVGPDGKSIFITTVGGKPLSKIPPGFKTRAVYDKDKADEKDKTVVPPTTMVRKREEPLGIDSFEAPEGEDGGRVITPESLTGALSALAAMEGNTTALGALATVATNVLGVPAPIGIMSSIFGLGAKATVVSMLSQLGVIEGPKNPKGINKGKNYTAKELLAIANQKDDFGRTIIDQIDMNPKNPLSAVHDLRPQTLEGSDGKSYKADYTRGTRTQEFEPPKPSEKSVLQIAQENIAKEQAAIAAAKAKAKAEDAETADDLLGGTGITFDDPTNISAYDPDGAGDAEGVGAGYGGAPQGSSGGRPGEFSTTIKKGGLIEKRKTTAKKKKNSKGLVNKRKTPSKKKKKGPRGLASSK